MSLSAKGLLNKVDDFKDIVITTSPDGGIVRLKDISRVELGADTYQMNARYDNSPSVIIGLSQTPNSNSLKTMAAVKTEIEKLSKTFPDDIEFKVSASISKVSINSDSSSSAVGEGSKS